jgi:nucleotide-binding universal stress UspA family protein
MILVGIDGSPASTAALEWAVRHARNTGSRILAVSVCRVHAVAPSSTPLPVTEPVGVDAFRDRHLGHLSAALDHVRTESADVPIDQLVPRGEAGPVLCELSTGADLLVVGGHGYSRLAHAVLGSVTAYCLRHAKSPVVVIPPALITAPAANLV